MGKQHPIQEDRFQLLFYKGQIAALVYVKRIRGNKLRLWDVWNRKELRAEYWPEPHQNKPHVYMEVEGVVREFHVGPNIPRTVAVTSKRAVSNWYEKHLRGNWWTRFCDRLGSMFGPSW